MTAWAGTSDSALGRGVSPGQITETPAEARTEAIHAAHSWSSGVKSTATSRGLAASDVRENFSRVRRRSHSSRGGRAVTAPPVIRAVIRSYADRSESLEPG